MKQALNGHVSNECTGDLQNRAIIANGITVEFRYLNLQNTRYGPRVNVDFFGYSPGGEASMSSSMLNLIASITIFVMNHNMVELTSAHHAIHVSEYVTLVVATLLTDESKAHVPLHTTFWSFIHAN